jgi:hypothetical protein
MIGYGNGDPTLTSKTRIKKFFTHPNRMFEDPRAWVGLKNWLVTNKFFPVSKVTLTKYIM